MKITSSMLLLAIWLIVSGLAAFIPAFLGGLAGRDFGDSGHRGRRLHLAGSLGQYSHSDNRPGGNY